MIDLVEFKEVIGWMLGASIAVVWLSFGLLSGMLGAVEGRMFLVVAISLTILLGTGSGGLIALGQMKTDYKEIVGWMLGASIAVIWVSFGMLSGMLGAFEGRLFLVIALASTILLGTASGGLIALSIKNKGI